MLRDLCSDCTCENVACGRCICLHLHHVSPFFNLRQLSPRESPPFTYHVQPPPPLLPSIVLLTSLSNAFFSPLLQIHRPCSSLSISSKLAFARGFRGFTAVSRLVSLVLTGPLDPSLDILECFWDLDISSYSSLVLSRATASDIGRTSPLISEFFNRIDHTREEAVEKMIHQFQTHPI